MLIDGKCHCGRISYAAEIDPATVGICHCTDCQTMSGSAFRVIVPAPAEGFRLLCGEPKRYVKTAESGRRRVQAFCGDCGTRPSKQSWCRSAIPWVTDLRDIKRFETQSW